MQSLLEMAAIRVALLLAEGRLPMGTGVRVPAQPSDAIFVALRRLGRLNRETLDRLFGGNFMLSAGVDLTDGDCDEETLWMLAHHVIRSLSLSRTTTSSATETRLLLPRVVFCLRRNSPFLRHLRCLDLGGFLPAQPFNVLPMINLFSSLETLIISEAASLSNDDLAVICRHHSMLRHLDISNCPDVTNISSLRLLTHLEVVRMHGICLNMQAAEIASAFRAWSQLKEIDISCTTDGAGVDPGVVLLDELKANGGRPIWPRLHSLDLAGLLGGLIPTRRLRRRLQALVDSHQKLLKISLLATPLSHRTLTASDGRQLQLASAATATNAKTALSLYSKTQRTSLAVHALNVLPTRGFVSSLSDEDCLECISLVADAMRFHSSTEAVQENGALCQLVMSAPFLQEYIYAHAEHFGYGVEAVSRALLPNMLERCCDAAEAFQENERIVERSLRLFEMLRSEVGDYLRVMRIGLNLMVKRGGFIGDGFDEFLEYPFYVERSELDPIAADDRMVPVVLSWLRNGIELNEDPSDEGMEFLCAFASGRPAICRQIVENAGVELSFHFILDSEGSENDHSNVLRLLTVLAKEESSVSAHLCRQDYIRPLFRLLERPPSEEVFRNASKELWIRDQFLAGFILAHLLNSPD